LKDAPATDVGAQALGLAEPTEARDPAWPLFLRFLRFGLLAWGGPAAQTAMIAKECVDEEGWVSQETFKKTLAVYQVLPGPEAHELCVFFGRLRGGRRGGLAAGLGFMLPGFVLMLGLSVLYVGTDLSRRFEELFYGLNAAVGALVAMAIVRLGRKFITDVPLALLAVAAFALTAAGVLAFAGVLVVTGLAYWAWHEATARMTTGAAAVTPAPLLVAAVVAGAIGTSLLAEIFFEGLKAGLLTFGGAYTVVPFLHDTAVQGQGWLTDSQFLDGLALSGVLPAPLIIFATFVGYIAGGLTGSIAITVGIFLPAFIFPIFFHRFLVAVAEDARIRPFLLGVAAGVIGLIGAVTLEILETSVVDVPTALLAVGAFATLYRSQGKLTVLAVVLSCGAIGAILRAAAVV